MPLLWFAAACVSIAVNGSRGLPQYFLQALPALALAAGLAWALVWPRSAARGGSRCASLATQRITNFDKAVDYLRGT